MVETVRFIISLLLFIGNGAALGQKAAPGDKTDPGKPDRAAFLGDQKAQPDFNKAKSIRPILFL